MTGGVVYIYRAIRPSGDDGSPENRHLNMR